MSRGMLSVSHSSHFPWPVCCSNPKYSTDLKAVEHHLPCGIAQCYLPPITSEHTTPARQVGTQLSYPRGMEGWVDLGDWLHTEMVYLSLSNWGCYCSTIGSSFNRSYFNRYHNIPCADRCVQQETGVVVRQTRWRHEWTQGRTEEGKKATRKHAQGIFSFFIHSFHSFSY